MFSALQTRYNSVFDATLGKLWISRVWDSIDRSCSSSRKMLSKHDVWLAIGLSVIGMLISIWGFAQTNRVPEIHTTFDLWFDADIARVAENLVTNQGDHARTAVHPVLSILLYPFGGVLTALGMDPLIAAKAFLVLVSGANAALFSLIIRLLGLPRLVVALLTLVFMSTASFIFWSSVVESHPFSSFSALMALFLMVRVTTAHWGWWVAVNVLTLGFLITNWIFALVAMAVRLKLKPFLANSMAAFIAVVALAVIQNATFEKAALFFNPETLLRETHHTKPDMASEGVTEEGWRPTSHVRSIYLTTVVAMPVDVEHGYRRLVTTNQYTSFPSGEISPLIASAAWLVLLAMGMWGAARRKDIRLLLIGTAILLAIKTAFFSIYGPVTFLYSPNFMPLLLLFASMAWYAPYRNASWGLAGLVIVFAGINNEKRLDETINLAGCLSEIDEVMQLHSYDNIKVKVSEILSDHSHLYTEDVLACRSLAQS